MLSKTNMQSISNLNFSKLNLKKPSYISSSGKGVDLPFTETNPEEVGGSIIYLFIPNCIYIEHKLTI